MSNRPHLFKAWLAGFTRRWHSNPDLCATSDAVAGHSGRVGVLAHLLFPDSSKSLIVAALLHDLGESGVGDVAAPAGTSAVRSPAA